MVIYLYNMCKFYVCIMILSIFFCDISIFLTEKIPDTKVFHLISGIVVYLFNCFLHFA